MLKGQQILRWEPKVSEFSRPRSYLGMHCWIQSYFRLLQPRLMLGHKSTSQEKVLISKKWSGWSLFVRQGWQKVGLEAKRTQFRGLYIGRCPVHWRCLKIARGSHGYGTELAGILCLPEHLELRGDTLRHPESQPIPLCGQLDQP